MAIAFQGDLRPCNMIAEQVASSGRDTRCTRPRFTPAGGYAGRWLGLEPGRKLQLPSGLLFCYTKSMKKARAVKQKVMGRPRTGITPLMGFRADPATRAAIVRWAENQADTPSLSEAIRRLVELGLKAKGK
jgi:hypothetical protein